MGNIYKLLCIFKLKILNKLKIYTIAFSRDSNYMATGGTNKKISLYNV